MRKQWVLVIAILVILVGGVTALVFFGPQVEAVAVGAHAPDYRVVSLATGDSVSLRSRYKGDVTLVNIWATWCGPCKAEMPAIQEAYAALKPAGFHVAAISVDQGPPSDVKDYVRAMGLTFDIYQDQSTHIEEVYQTTGVPESFLLDRQGRIVKRVIGSHDWNSPVNRALIRRLLGEPGS